MIAITILRRGASKRIGLSSTKENYLSILQILESTSDVVDYKVAELDMFYRPHDLYLKDTQGFDKWKPITKTED